MASGEEHEACAVTVAAREHRRDHFPYSFSNFFFDSEGLLRFYITPWEASGEWNHCVPHRVPPKVWLAFLHTWQCIVPRLPRD